jgi:hypothetical protein
VARPPQISLQLHGADGDRARTGTGGRLLRDPLGSAGRVDPELRQDRDDLLMPDDLPPWAYMLIGGGLVWWYLTRHHPQQAGQLPMPLGGSAQAIAAGRPGMVGPNAEGQFMPKPSWWDAPETTARMRLDYLGLSPDPATHIRWS